MALSSGLATAGDTNALKLQPRGALVASDPNHLVFKTGAEYHFRYTDGAVTREYVINMASVNVAAGMLEVRELTSNSYPISQGGLAWRHGAEQWRPALLSSRSVTKLLHEHLDTQAEVLTLKYRDDVDHDQNSATPRIAAAKTYEFRLVGKVLRIRASADGALNAAYDDNYCYLRPGPSASTPSVKEQHIPYMDNAIVCAFAPSGSTSPVFYSLLLDYYASNGALTHALSMPLPGDPPAGPNAYEHFYPMDTSISSASVAPNVPAVLAPVDDTLNVIVTSRIEDTFPVSPNYRSPYYKLCSGRTEIFAGQQGLYSWKEYKEQYDRLREWGVTDLNIQQYFTFTYGPGLLLPELTHPGPLGCDPTVLSTLVTSFDPVTKLWWLDPTDPAVGIQADTEFANLAASAHSTGGLFAHTVVHGDMDIWGFPPYVQGGHPCPPLPYPTSLALGTLGSSVFGPPAPSGPPCGALGCGFGLVVPSSNPAVTTSMNTTYPVRDQAGQRKAGWDSHHNLTGTSWHTGACPPGFAEGIVNSKYMTPYLQQQLQYGVSHFAPTSVRIDAMSTIPGSLHIDQVAASDRSHRASEFLKQRNATFRDVRRYVGGPLYGESQYWRFAQNYDHGLRDGHPWNFPAIEDSTTDGVGNEDGFVIPDYNLAEVLSKSSGHSGVGQEGTHRWQASLTYPIDGIDGDNDSFIDSFLTTTATYGNNAYVSSNGHNGSPPWTYQGMLRSYFMLTGLARRVRESTLTSVDYADANSQFKKLGEAIMTAGMDLRESRVRIQWTTPSGATLKLFANHSAASAPEWRVTVPTPGGGAETLFLRRNSFAAGDGEKLLVFFNARPGGFTEYFDFVEYANVHKMINARRPSTSTAAQIDYRGFPSELGGSAFSPSDAQLLATGMISRSYFSNRAVGAVAGVWNTGVYTVPPSTPTWAYGKVVTSTLLPAAVPASIRVECEATQLRVGKTEGCVVIATYSNGGEQDVTALVGNNGGWSVTGPATVDRVGGVTANATSGPVTVTAQFPGVGPASIAFNTVVAGAPNGSVSVSASGYPGETAKLDVPNASDPKAGYVDTLWDFGDLSPRRSGRTVSHTYHKPGAFALTSTLGDVEENEQVLNATAVITGAGNLLWGDDFDDGALDGWNLNGGQWWGVGSGALRQGEATSTYRFATIAGEIFPRNASFGSEIRMRNLGATGIRAAGIHVRKTNEGDAPLVSGYSVLMKSSGQLFIQEPGANNPAPPTPTVPGFSSTVPHDLRVLTVHNTSTASTKVLVFVDGVQYIAWTDTTPQSQGYAGVTSLNQEPEFDSVRVADHRAPYLSASQLFLNGGGNTLPTVYIDDQDGVGGFSETNLQLDVVKEFAGGSSQTTHYSSSSVPSIATLFGAWTNASNGTTRSAQLSTSIETLRGAAANVRLEFTLLDSAGRVGRRVFRY